MSDVPEDLLGELKELEASLRGEMRSQWDRDLPFEELLFDRWERAQRLGFGEGSSIYHNSYVMFEVTVGANTWIGPFVLIDGRGGVSIGDHCDISAGVHIYSHDTVRRALTGGRQPLESAPVRINSNTYIGSQVVITKGVTIGDHCVVGANSLVNGDLEPFTIAMGTPARKRGEVEITDTGDVILHTDKSGK